MVLDTWFLAWDELLNLDPFLWNPEKYKHASMKYNHTRNPSNCKITASNDHRKLLMKNEKSTLRNKNKVIIAVTSVPTTSFYS
jgi:hypothetical protein